MLGRQFRILAMIIVPALVISLASVWWSGSGDAGTHAELPVPFPAPLTSWAEHVETIDRAIATHQQRAGREPTDWLSPSAEAASWIDRASMTGRWQDYAEAERALAMAMARAPESNKPYPLAARLALALHRNQAVEPALTAAVADRTFREVAPQADAAAMRGDVAMYQGDWQTADRLYLSAMTASPDAAFAMRRAFILERTGEAGMAHQAWIDAAWVNPRPTRRMLAAIALRLGHHDLTRGQWSEAAAHYADADRLLPGDWHVAASLLQMRALDGDLTGALAGMEALAQRHDLPELWDAVAAWKQAAGDASGARVALDRAARGWHDWTARYPEAAAAHAADHALIAGDRDAAVRWAEANYRQRPYGDAAILLATALTAKGDYARARPLLTPVTASGWRTMEGDRLGFELAALAGDGDAAEAAQAAALERNPRAFDPAARLILFGLH